MSMALCIMAQRCSFVCGVVKRVVFNKASVVSSVLRTDCIRPQPFVPSRCLMLCSIRYCLQQNSPEEIVSENSAEAVEENIAPESKKLTRPVVDVQTSIKYLQSKAYRVTYGDSLVWEPYRRNFKGQRPPRKTRKTCIRHGVLSSGNPCPICRDEYLVLHAENMELLKQFISPYTGKVLSYEKTGLCQKQHNNLLVAVQQAWDQGIIDMPLPFRQYDYREFYQQLSSRNQ